MWTSVYERYEVMSCACNRVTCVILYPREADQYRNNALIYDGTERIEGLLSAQRELLFHASI